MQGKIAIRGIRGRAPKSPTGFVLGSNPKTGNIELQPRAAFVDAAGATAAVVNSGVIPAPANPSATAGPSAVNGTATSYMTSDSAPAVQIGSATQKGLLQVDGTTIVATAGVISTVQPTGADPSAVAGPVAVNGSASTFMRSDGAPAIQVGSSSQKGILQVDGSTITVASGVVSALAQRHLYAPCVVSSLPAGAQGDRGLVTDATVSLALGLGLAPTGGGTNKAPVYFDGTSWLIG